MREGKLKTLKKAMLYSYQAATIALQDNNSEYTRQFKCLINKDKLKDDYDIRILSIPYKDIQLNAPRIGKTSQGQQEIGIKMGDTFYWTETDTYWIVYLNHLEEDAYFRADIKLCEKTVTINNHLYHVYYRGPVETQIQWNQKDQKSWNEMNYSAIINITRNAETLEYFHRFAQIEIDGKPWEIKAVNEASADGIIEVQLGETYTNIIKKEREEELAKQKPAPEPLPFAPNIQGEKEVYPYDIVKYDIINDEGGEWKINSKKARIIKSNQYSVTIEIITGKSGEFTLSYEKNNEIDTSLLIKIKPM